MERVLPEVGIGCQSFMFSVNGVLPLLSTIVTFPLCCAKTTTKSPAVAPAGAETDIAVPVLLSFFEEERMETAILL